MKKVKSLIADIYGNEKCEEIIERIDILVAKFSSIIPTDKKYQQLSQKDIALICYADNIHSTDSKSLKVMSQFFDKNLKDIISHIHFLPFYPYTSDDGFAVQNFIEVNSEYGNWKDIEEIGENFQLIFDAVINHISSQHHWFQQYLQSNPKYKDYFIEMNEDADVSKVMRARDLPLLSKFEKGSENKYLWTTFSRDQLDVNYKNPDVLLEMLEVLFFYISKGASIIRLDAIAYIWKKANSICINLPETHKIIMIIRQVIDQVIRDVMLLPEANVPSKENLQYLGNGEDEAQLIYQFSISPLVLYTFYSQNSKRLQDYLNQLPELSSSTHFFNVLATHDGIGLRPVRDILNSDEIDTILNNVEKRDGIISYKREKDGSKTPYEMNITYFDALQDVENSDEMNIDKFVAAHAILLSIQGFPALYFHSLFGTKNYYEGYKETGQPRTLNRRKFEYNELQELLYSEFSHESKVFQKMNKLLKIRRENSAFHPNSPQKVLHLSEKIFSIVRGDENSIIVLINITQTCQKVIIPNQYSKFGLTNIINNRSIDNRFNLQPFEIMWLKVKR